MALLAVAALAAPPSSPLHLGTSASAAGAWLDRLNAWRMSTGLASLTENTTWSQGDYNHAVYMVKNDLVTHYETVGVPYYTPEGDTAARDGNINVSSSTSTTDSQAIDWWMGAPFHAMGLMDPRLTQTAFGSYREVKSGWQMGAVVDTIRGNSFSGGQWPVLFPGNGTTEPLTKYSGGEFPDPLQACSGYASPTGLPIFVMVGGNVSTTVGAHSLTANGTALDHCVIDSSNAALGSYLRYRGGVVLIPRQALVNGVAYNVGLTVNGVAYSWSFTVGALAAVPMPPTAVSATASGNNVTLTWSPPADIGGPAIVSYTVTPYFGGVAQAAQTITAPTTTATFSGLSDWTAYRFAVSATNSLGTGGAAMSNYVIIGWQALGGNLTSDAEVATGAGRIDAFGRGTDNAIWHRAWNGTGWNAWESLGGILTSGPAAAVPSASRVDVFARGGDNALWHRAWDGAVWQPWESLGGSITSDPGAATWGDTAITVFVRGTDNGLWYRQWNGSAWGAWQTIAGRVITAPGVASWGPGRLDVVARGTDGAIWHRPSAGGGWGPWESLGGSGTTASAASSCGPGKLDIFGVGSDAKEARRFYSAGWSGWSTLGGQWSSGPGASCTAPSTVSLVERGPDNQLWYTTTAGA